MYLLPYEKYLENTNKEDCRESLIDYYMDICEMSYIRALAESCDYEQ